MCYSARESKDAYLFASLVCGLIVFGVKNPAVRSAALFLWFVAQMQALDWIFWETPDCGPVNQAATTTAILINHLQPVVFIATQALFGIPIRALSVLVLAAYIVGMIPYTLKALATVRCTRPEGGIMKWQWNLLPGGKPLYVLFLLSFIVTAFNFKNKTFAGMLAVIIIISVIAARKTPRLNASVGRVWCYFGAAAPLALIPWVPWA